jgi:rSAM/selenodomain-associated transferase 2
MPSLSIIIPMLNEQAIVAASLTRLQVFRDRGAELIVVDGGSADDSVKLAQPLADRVTQAPRGRALQMNAGAAIASGDILLFLHLDCSLPPNADQLLAEALRDTLAGWGHFDVEIEGRHALLIAIAWSMNRRSRWSGIATGDQAIFVRRSWFEAAGRYPPIALMEDIALSKALRARGRAAVVSGRVCASGRRWERNGVLRTVLLMWWLRLRYYFGGNPDRLAATYGPR